MMSLRINEAFFVVWIFVVGGSIFVANQRPDDVKEREGVTGWIDWRGALAGGGIGVVVSAVFLFASRR